jgi:BirA family biotin operon repressor/biotin-[acetyl-CoA-carboxylase] ligase
MNPFPHRLIHRFPETPSTNTLATEMLAQAERPAEGSVILTYHQTEGRGQQGSIWKAQAGLNLTFSLICYPKFVPIAEMFSLSKAACLAVRAAIEQLLPQADVLVKWPNDVLLNGKKVAGILIENQLEGSQLSSSIIGIGLNVNQLRFDPQFANKAISLQLAAGKSFELEEVLAEVLRQFDQNYALLRAGRRSVLDHAYLQQLYGYQEAVPIRVGNERKILPIIGIEKSGRMALQWEGKLRYFEVKEAQVEI